MSGRTTNIRLLSEAADTKSKPVVEFRDTSLVFPGEHQEVLALDRVSFTVPHGEITTVVGPSGCGKTTLLRLASGLTSPSAGAVLYKGDPIKALNAGIGYVTQDSNLFPWLTAIENIEFPLVVRGLPRAERREEALHWLNAVGLDGFGGYYPTQLSGGMQKRVSIARTLIYKPEVVLMDEPFGALDAQTRMMLHDQLLKIWVESKSTMLFITHDLVEAITLSDNVIIMTRRPGQVKEIYRVPLQRPRNVFEIYLEPGFDQAYAALWAHFKTELSQGAPNS